MSSYSKSITPTTPPRLSRGIQKRSPAERERLLARFRRSGQSQKRFCCENGLPISTLQYWLSQERAGRDAPEPIEGTFVQLPPAMAAAYAPIAGDPAAGTVQIRLPSQIELRVGVGADPAWVGALLQGVLTCSA
jgi:transposase-like protein